jgi:hypothetical protein
MGLRLGQLKRDFGAVTSFVTSPAQLRLEGCQYAILACMNVPHSN